MPLDLGNDDNIKFPDPQYLTLNSWKKGVITLVDKSRLPKDALAEATNLFLMEDGQPTLRPGVGWYGESPGRTAVGTSASRSPSASASPSSSVSASISPSASSSPSASLSPSASRSPSSSVSASVSPSASRSPSASQSLSPSASLSPSSSQSLSPSASSSPSASGSPSASTSPSHSISPSSSISSSVSASPSVGNWAQIDGFDYFDNNGTISLVAAAGGGIYRSLDDGVTWTACTGANYTAGTEVNMNQNNSYLYITNGTDNIIRYDGTTTLLQYTALVTSAAATVSRTGLAASNFTYYYKLSAVNKIGFTAVSPSVSQAVSLKRDSWDATTNYLTLTMPNSQVGQDRWDIYLSDNDLDYFYLDSIATPASGTAYTYKDDGTAIVVPSTTQPLTNTTSGPLVAELTNIGERMYGVRDSSKPYRIWFSGTGNFAGAFSNAYDGGYLDWQPGGKYKPVSVQDYRDGKGTPLATIWCKSADAQGCILQMSLDTLTVGDISITVPSAYRLPGSRGTSAPKSVINVLNDFMFYNSQGFYNLGSRSQFLNLLSTDESSANIRPTVRSISPTGESGIASTFFENKVYFSVPYSGSSTNNYTAVYDTERKAWMPTAFTLGFSKFLRYTDTGGKRRLLALKPGDTKLSEISINIQGDYGVAFESELLTGLYPTTKDRFGFQYVEEGEVEFSNPQGSITVELQGIDRVHGFNTIKSTAVSQAATTTSVGWDTFLWDTTLWNDTTVTATVVSESSTKRYFRVQKELNAVQWRVYTNTLNANYVLRTLQTWGTDTQAGHPQSWRLS